MDCEWDPGKAAENLRKHGVDFADAVMALEDENALTIGDPDHDEQHFKTLGMGLSLNSVRLETAYFSHLGVARTSAMLINLLC